MSEIFRVEWFDIRNENRNRLYKWLHEFFLKYLQSQSGINWVAHYEIVPHPQTPYIKNAPPKKEIKHKNIPPGRENLIITSANSAYVFFGPQNELNNIEKKYESNLSMRDNYRSAVFIEEESINGPEQNKKPLGLGGPPAMQFGSYNVDTINDDVELANWYRGERFPRLAVTRGMIRGRKLLSITGWAKHGVFWEFAEMEENEYSFEHRFIEADRGEDWNGRHVLEYVTHSPGSPHAGKRVWPKRTI